MRQLYNILLISAMSLILLACQGEEEALRENVGYLRVVLEQSKDVNTKAAVYNPKQMHVVIKDAEGKIAKDMGEDHTTWETNEIALAPGEYTIEAQSNGYDSESGEDRAYFVGTEKVTIVKEETITAKVVCSLANVKVTVAFEQSFLNKLGTGTIKVQVKSATAKAVDFNKSAEAQVTYFPLGDLTVAYTVTSRDGEQNSKEQQITGVKAKDHYILNFKNQTTSSGDVTVTVDPSMHLYTYDFTVDPAQTSGALLSASAWSRMAYLTATEISNDVTFSALKFQYRRKGTESWTDVETTPKEETATATATVKGLTANTEYEYQLLNGTDVIKADAAFTTETEVALYNGNFDEWWRKEDKNSSPWYAIASGDATSFDTAKGMLFSFWDSGNGGTVMLSKNPTMPEETEVHTTNGKAAKLASQFVGWGSLGKFAAGNLYTGHFCSANLSTYQACINFGQPFTSRPTQLKGWFKYNRGTTIDYPTGDGEYKTILANEGGDLCSVYIALVDNEGFEYDGKKFAYEVNGDLSGDDPASFKYKNAVDFSENNKNVIAYGCLKSEEEKGTGEWQEFTIDLKYRDLTRTPKYIIIVASASKYGDYFTGSKSSVMYVDDFSLIYGDNPQIQE